MNIFFALLSACTIFVFHTKAQFTMDNFIVSARKYRPSTFQSVVGQKSLTTTLKNAITGNKLAHAYLFSGPRGVGKTTCARIFAKTINCLNLSPEREACNACESCVAFNEQRSYNIHELDAASNNGVDDIRVLIEQVRIPPQIGRYKVYIIDEVHMLSKNSFNAFLKTLEEPPAHAVFILATTEKHKIIPTILSRCQVYDFNRISVNDTIDHLQYVAQKEGVHAEIEALSVIAQKSDGGMRDALSIFDQLVSFTGGNITYQTVIENLNVLDYDYYFRLTEAILAGNVPQCLLILNDILNHGFEGQHIITGLTSHFRDLLICKNPATAQLFQVGEAIRTKYVAIATQCSINFLYKAIDLANECDLNYRISKNKRLLIELMLIRLCQLLGSTVFSSDDDRKPELKQVQPMPTTHTQSPAVDGASSKEIQVSTVESTPSVNPVVSTPTPTTATAQAMPMGVSLSSLQTHQKEETKKEVEEIKQTQSNPFSESDLIAAWKEYADGLKEEILLKNAMNYYAPKLLTDTQFEVIVNSDIISDNSPAITSFLRNRLQNDSIEMIVKISETNANTKATTPRELFDEMVEENPVLQKLSDKFGLELS